MLSKSLANKKKFETDCLSNKTFIWIHWYIYLSLRNYMELNDCCRFDHCSICSTYVLALHFVYLIVTFLFHVNFFVIQLVDIYTPFLILRQWNFVASPICIFSISFIPQKKYIFCSRWCSIYIYIFLNFFGFFNTLL